MIELLCFLVLMLILMGIFLCFYKRYPGLPKENALALRIAYIKDKLKVSEAAKAVHIKELSKETAKKFTKAWFFEYWQGNRSAWWAFWTWAFAFKLFLGVIGMVSAFVILGFHEQSFEIVKSVIVIVTYSIAPIIVWRCARNATRGWKYVARIWSVLAVVSLLESLLYISGVLLA